MRSSLPAFGACAFALLTLAPSGASAYCRTTTCDPALDDCRPPPCVEIGLPLYWPGKCVSYNLGAAAGPGIPFSTFSDVSWTAFNAWTQATCTDGQTPSIQIFDLGPIACPRAEYQQNSGNVNAVFFQSQKWPYTASANTLALTTVTFNTQTGEIYDVDMEINSAENTISTSDSQVGYDLLSILTHEAGHFYGLAHTDVLTATMYEEYKTGSTTMRSLESDDIEGICAIYPSSRSAGACDPTPRHGWGSSCLQPKEASGCSVGDVGSHAPRGSRTAIAALGLALAYLLRRSRVVRS